jgi:hypothetical protein
VSDPVYVLGLDGTLVSYEVVGGDRVRESVLDLDTWQAWFGAVGTTTPRRCRDDEHLRALACRTTPRAGACL